MPKPPPPKPLDTKSLAPLIRQAKKLARAYYAKTGRPLGITGEIAEYEACRLLKLCPAPVRTSGYDATRTVGRRTQRVQVKGRVRLPGSNRSQRVGSIGLAHKWDSAVLVMLDDRFEPTEILEATRSSITRALSKPGSRARNERGQLNVSQFRAIARPVWKAS
jgi:hypothetical protein